MTANSVIKLEMHMQGHEFQISALIVDNLVGVDLIRGTNTLAELDGTLNFKEHTFKIKPKKISFAPTNKVVLKPGETKYITLQGKTPLCVKNSEVIINANKHLSSKCCPSTMIVSLHRGRTKIAVTNTSDKPVHFSKGRPIAFLNLGQHVTFTQELPVDDIVMAKKSDTKHSPTVNSQTERQRTTSTRTACTQPHLHIYVYFPLRGGAAPLTAFLSYKCFSFVPFFFFFSFLLLLAVHLLKLIKTQ